MQFDQIVVLDDVRISDQALADLKNYSKDRVKVFDSDPKDDQEIIERIGGADCVLLSWRTPVNREILSACGNLKFIALCGTNSNYIDLEACRKSNVVVSNVVDYGDEGVVEYTFFQLISLVRGFGKYQWKDSPAELNGKTLGIIGLGAVGQLLAKAALGFKMKVLYHSKTRKPEWEEQGLLFADKRELLEKSDFISLQSPRDVKVLDKDDFGAMKGKVLVNTTLGKAFDENDLKAWLKQDDNYAIMDICPSRDFYESCRGMDRVIFSDFISGRTRESILRLSQKVLDNLSAFLAGQPINQIN